MSPASAERCRCVVPPNHILLGRLPWTLPNRANRSVSPLLSFNPIQTLAVSCCIVGNNTAIDTRQSLQSIFTHYHPPLSSRYHQVNLSSRIEAAVTLFPVSFSSYIRHEFLRPIIWILIPVIALSLSTSNYALFITWLAPVTHIH